ncbi:hypothetical protein [Blastococcus tunisiensis]|uniref:Uncharacterized protein n=1 Tax=Blastococcus tunisiensis TaxID=1798228 RepID=A0A1I2K6M5_9ACTN|nr:hypothetical protein [Blastococcus sp. DSM 46838]SFF61989.1 hypothetical protein SAMN05216574_11974 [Blastococcus sp. DSM 46838]
MAVEAPTEPTPSEAPAPSVPEPEPAAGAPAGGGLENGSADPKLGVAYRFDRLTHCGMDWTRFGGRDWKTVQPTSPAPGKLPPPGQEISTISHYIGGTIALVE